jgi:Protein of unknown function (DUF2909)
MKYFLSALFVLILLALGAGGFFMLRGGNEQTPKTKKMARALAIRVALSVLVFVMIWVSYGLDWLSPTGIVLRH